MKRLFTIFATLAIAIAMSGTVSAQRGHGGKRPTTTGLEHAETTANHHGQRGIENAEAKQAEHEKDGRTGPISAAHEVWKQRDYPSMATDGDT